MQSIPQAWEASLASPDACAERCPGEPRTCPGDLSQQSRTAAPETGGLCGLCTQGDTKGSTWDFSLRGKQYRWVSSSEKEERRMGERKKKLWRKTGRSSQNRAVRRTQARRRARVAAGASEERGKWNGRETGFRGSVPLS